MDRGGHVCAQAPRTGADGKPGARRLRGVRDAEASRAAEESPSLSHAFLAAAAIARSDRETYIVSHESAALSHGLNLLKEPQAGTVSLTRRPLSANGRTRRGARVIVRVAGLPGPHLREISSIRVTTEDRTVADLARILSFMEGVAGRGTSAAGYRFQQRPGGVRPRVVCQGRLPRGRTAPARVAGDSRHWQRQVCPGRFSVERLRKAFTAPTAW